MEVVVTAMSLARARDRFEHDVTLERRILHREVGAEVGPAALLTDESALRDEPREKVRRGP